jgi:hypothetical protein
VSTKADLRKTEDPTQTDTVKNEDGVDINPAVPEPSHVADVEQPFISAGQASDIRIYGQASDHFTGKTLTSADLA